MTEFDFITALLPNAPALATLFFLWKSGVISFTKNGNGEKMPKWAEDLKEYVNHDQTELLKEIRDGINKLDERGEGQCRKLDIIIQRHEEIEKYGVRPLRE